MRPSLALVGLLICGCAHQQAVVPSATLDPQALWQKVLQAHAGPDTLTSDGKAFVDAPVNAGRYALHLSVKRPASLRIEALTPLGDPAAVLVADAGRFALFDLRRNEFYRGPSTPENLSRLFPVPLRDDELVSLFLGGVPELRGAQPTAVTIEGDHYHFVLQTSELQEDVLVHLDDLRVLEVRRQLLNAPAGEQPLWRVVLEEHDDSSGFQIPTIVKLGVPSQKIFLDLRLRDTRVGAPPPFAAFALQPPPGVRVIELDQDNR